VFFIIGSISSGESTLELQKNEVLRLKFVMKSCPYQDSVIVLLVGVIQVTHVTTKSAWENGPERTIAMEGMQGD
jgi:hypothetical protein